MKSMQELKNMLCKELDEIVMGGEINYNNLEVIHKLVATIHHILEIDANHSSEHPKASKWEKDDTQEDDSEFIAVMSDASPEEAIKIMDEHMETIRALYPKEYRALINKIKNCKND